MQEFLFELARHGYIIPLAAIVIGGLIAIIGIIAGSWSKMRRQDMEAALKHKMLDQGMSAEDIKKVLGASYRGGSSDYCSEEGRPKETSEHRG